MIKKTLLLLSNIINAYAAWFTHLLTENKKTIWLVGGINGELYSDNSKVFYEFLIKDHPEISIYWVARNGSPAFLEAEGDVLARGSFRNYLLFFQAKVVVFSDTFNSDIAPKIFILPGLRKYYNNIFKVRLNHGTIAFKKMPTSNSTIIQHLKDKILLSYDLSTASTQLEVDVMNTYMRKGTVVLTGSARNDSVIDFTENDKSIFIAPTWRTWLHNKKTIKNSEFYINYSLLLSNEELLSTLRKHNIIIKFFIHHLLIKFLDEFRHLENDVVKILPTNINIAPHIISSSLMITDYSSICSERYYLNKPVLFFHFDKSTYCKTMGSYINLDDDIFGDIEYTVDGLIKKITNNYLTNNFTPSPKQKEGDKYFIHFKDRNNCKRIFNEIIHRTEHKNH